MYLDFYGLKSAPFPLTPDPTLLFVSPSHKAALDALTHGITARKGLVVITGASGVGKTTLVHAYLARVAPPQLTTLVLWQAHLSFMEILALMARRFDMPVATDDPRALRTEVQQRLLHEADTGRNVALLIDEAQHLPLDTLEQLWELATLPPARACPLQIVLLGQPALQQHLQGRHLNHVAQGLGLRATLGPLSEADSVAYIRQHVAKMALPGGAIFTPGALQALVRHAQGVPRVLNRLCTEVLEAGCRAQQQPITAGLVQQVLAASTDGKSFPLGRLGLAATAGLVLAASLLWVAPFRTRPPALLSRPTAGTHLAREAPSLQQPATAPQARGESPPDSARSHDRSADHVRLVPLEAVERQRLEPAPATPIPRVIPTRPARTTARVTARPPGPPTPPTTTEIMVPRPGATVGQTVTVAGLLAAPPTEQHVFLCLQSQAFGRRIYPQGQVIPDDRGRWEVKSIYATTGYKYATFLVRTANPTSAALLNTPYARKYGLHDLPPRTERLGPTIVVMRE